MKQYLLFAFSIACLAYSMYFIFAVTYHQPLGTNTLNDAYFYDFMLHVPVWLMALLISGIFNQRISKIIKYSGIFSLMMLVSCSESVNINGEFKIEYWEMYSSISLHNEHQGFVPNVTEAYWNKDSLVVSGETGCFLIEFGKTKYNDEMIKIECGDLSQKLKKGTIRKFIKK